MSKNQTLTPYVGENLEEIDKAREEIREAKRDLHFLEMGRPDNYPSRFTPEVNKWRQKVAQKRVRIRRNQRLINRCARSIVRALVNDSDLPPGTGQALNNGLFDNLKVEDILPHRSDAESVREV